MAFLKFLRGKRANLPEDKIDGQAYFCADDASFHVDYVDENGQVQRKQLNAKDSETLSGASLSTSVVESDTIVPTSKAVFTLVGTKADKEHTHDDRYYTESEIDLALSGLASITVVDNKITSHNTSTDAHSNMGWLTREDVDAELSDTSTNPVQNKVLNEEIGKIHEVCGILTDGVNYRTTVSICTWEADD